MTARSISQLRIAIVAAVVVLNVSVSVFRCDAFSSTLIHHRISSTSSPVRTSSTSRYVLAQPPKDVGGTVSGDFPRPRAAKNIIKTKQQRGRRQHHSKRDDVWSSGRWNRAVQVEARFLSALEAFQLRGEDENEVVPTPFPGIRECNAALAAFGDGGDLLRSLRLYFKMRKVALLAQRTRGNLGISTTIPKPTLVTFSTIMSRALYLGKPHVALRLWNIMAKQPDFFSSESNVPAADRIVPDVKAANILMNCYAKLGDLEAAKDLLDQMIHGEGTDVPRMRPNLVSYNTLLDACHKSGELDAAIHVKEQMDAYGIQSDARTYTTMIATVARKASSASGANDPTLAFSFVQEMKNLNIRPNGMTYSALIDACGRCRRSDLALKGLRLMLDQKAEAAKHLNLRGSPYTLQSEVGAWTAAINACGKAGRMDTAMKLFYSMPNFGASPNTVTCGCLVDCLLRDGRTAQSLEVLRYMKKHRIVPSEVMYTSLMTSAGKLALFEKERHSVRSTSSSKQAFSASADSFPLDDSGATKAVEVYTELMTSLMQQPKGVRLPKTIDMAGSNGQDEDSSELFRVSLVFQEMKAIGVEADLGCYNAVLKACANDGDIQRASDVLEQILASEELVPNDKTYQEVIRAAGKAGRVDLALKAWRTAVEQTRQSDNHNLGIALSSQTLGALLMSLLRSAGDRKLDSHTKLQLYQVVVNLYEATISEEDYLGAQLVDQDELFSSARTMILFLQAVVALEGVTKVDSSSTSMDQNKLQSLGTAIVSLEAFADGLPESLLQHHAAAHAFQIAKNWLDEADDKRIPGETMIL